MRRRIRILPICQTAPIIVRIVGDNAARPGALRELTVGGVGVGRAFAVGIDFVGHCTGSDVVEPGGCITDGRHGGRPSRVAEGGHRGLVAENVVGVAGGIGSSTLVSLAATEVVFIDYCVAKGIYDGDKIAELVAGVGRAVAKGVDGSGALAKGIVFGVTCIATAVGVGDLAAEGIVGDGVGDSGDRDIHQRYAVTRD